ncbi:formaldehyde-activating enzyme [Cryobacterium sp. CG_9.6]|uniref:formaldehyde-activating enzyme n=1 Tax=Cryobacterium sp. CG_9.6 TaxID=2760710 RepID=UPI002476C52D|nr:formaldehyde-activating enzyme [Cryobacterium sp. CG_9.6]MDH6235851.1 5,6,7,8-tetrahydromethanopterin hydro-lyase [Cryobacterium sp. CG_9.6]
MTLAPRAAQALQIGESFVGDGVNAAHVNTVFGHREGPAGVAWATALATPSTGHVPFVTVLRPSLPVKPLTLFVTKAAPASDAHGLLIWGPAQAGIAAGVAEALFDGTISREQADSWVIIAAVWVNPAADDAEAVYANNRLSVHTALVNGTASLPSADAVIAARDSPSNPFFTPAASDNRASSAIPSGAST